MPHLLFDTKRRIDRSPARPSERMFQFLNRSGSSYFEMVRNLMEDWLDNVPIEHRPGLIGGLRGNNGEHASAFWELYLHEGYLRSGYSIEIHPSLDGTDKRPDFLIRSGDGTTFYLEAVSVGKAPRTVAQEKHLNDITTQLASVESADFVVLAQQFSIGERAPKTGPLRSELEDWLSKLDWDQVRFSVRESTELGFDKYPVFRWKKDGWDLEFHALPKDQDRRAKRGPTISSIGPGEAQMVDNTSGLTKVLDKKQKRYGKLEAPLVIAVQSNSVFPTEDYEFGQVLYGLSGFAPDSAALSHANLSTEGFWRTRLGWRRSHCPQVISVSGLSPWSVVSCVPRVWSTLEPGVCRPVQPGWMVPMVAGAEYLPGHSDDVATHFQLDKSAWQQRPDFGR